MILNIKQNSTETSPSTTDSMNAYDVFICSFSYVVGVGGGVDRLTIICTYDTIRYTNWVFI